MHHCIIDRQASTNKVAIDIGGKVCIRKTILCKIINNNVRNFVFFTIENMILDDLDCNNKFYS